VLTVGFQDPDEDLETISWDEWFRKFDEQNLASLYQDQSKDGSTPRFFKLVRR
jgi:hypothetical protein